MSAVELEVETPRICERHWEAKGFTGNRWRCRSCSIEHKRASRKQTGDYAGANLRNIRLSTVPLATYVEFCSQPIKPLMQTVDERFGLADDSAQTIYHRAVRRGTVSVLFADMVCVVLGVNPTSIYGLEFLDAS